MTLKHLKTRLLFGLLRVEKVVRLKGTFRQSLLAIHKLIEKLIKGSCHPACLILPKWANIRALPWFALDDMPDL
jgi:hypothetical protein